MSKVLVLIPSRMSAKRLHGKPLLKINNIPIISHVFYRGIETKLGEVIVCTEDQEIIASVEKNNGKAILTGTQHKNGTERIYEGLKKLKIKDVSYVISLQGDEPAINPEDIKKLFNFMIKYNSEIGTLGAEIKEDSILNNENIVKVITDKKINDQNFPVALDFKRKVDDFNANTYHHLGVYAYKPDVLKRIIKHKQTNNEIQNRLEQLRALENGIKINVALAKFCPIGIDTMEDYLALKKKLEYNS